jgi:protein SCO1/2
VYFPAYNRIIRAFIGLPVVLSFVMSAAAIADVPAELQGAGITEHPGDSVLLNDPAFRDENGTPVHLSQYFKNGKPVVLVLAYFECPNLCTFVLNGVTDAMKGLEWLPGKQFEVVTLSINPREKPELARAKKATYLASLGKPEAAAGWHFLTGDEGQIRKLAGAVGYGYKWMEQDKQYAHSAAIFVLTPDGRLSRYLYGIEYKPKDLKLALLEASNGKIGTVIDRILLFCYRYNPQTRKYSVYLTQLMQASGAGTVVVFGGYLAIFWRRQRKKSSKGALNV